MFTKIANVILVLGVAAGLIGSIIGGVLVGTTNAGVGFLVILIGCVVTIVASTGFGMIVEMATNINKSRAYLEMLCGKAPGTPPAPQTKPVPTWTCPHCQTKNSDDYHFCTKCRTPKPASEEFWYCSKCGEKNESVRQYCMVCGAPQKAVKQIPVSPKNYWKCPQCDEMNDEFSYTCKKCGKSKH